MIRGTSQTQELCDGFIIIQSQNVPNMKHQLRFDSKYDSAGESYNFTSVKYNTEPLAPCRICEI